jgi:predicted NUDIX family NTP pyrophosphohydrolase
MPTTSAGILLYRYTVGGLEVLLVHPGGPFWKHKDLGAWSIPKGEVTEGEDLFAAAQREFHEETGFNVEGHAIPLGHVRQSGGKIVHAWAVRGDVDPKWLRSNTFEIEWPHGSKQIQQFPEVDKAGWFKLAEARRRIVSAQVAFLEALVLTDNDSDVP